MYTESFVQKIIDICQCNNDKSKSELYCDDCPFYDFNSKCDEEELVKELKERVLEDIAHGF